MGADVQADLGAEVERDALPSRARVFGGALLGGAVATGASVGATALVGFAVYRRCTPPPSAGEPDDALTFFGDDGRRAIHCAFPVSQAILHQAAFAYAPTIAGGAALGARLAGGVGRYDLALLGSSLGTAAGFGLLASLVNASDRAFAFGMFMLPVLQWIGGAIGASSGSLRRERAVGPTLSLGRDGGVLGLAGRF